MVEAVAPQKSTVRGWVKVFRDPPFYLAGVLPFSLGVMVAVREGTAMSWAVWALGCVAVALLMAMTFLINEYFDYETDLANVNYNKFTGGSRALPDGLVERRHVLTAAGVCALVALALGVLIQFGLHTGPLTLPLGALAAFLGYAYTGAPFRLIYRGLGELLIGVSVGWMPVIIGYYVIGGWPDDPFAHLMSLPIVLACTMMIVINEYPDYESDKASGKLNIIARMGRERGAWVYTALGLMFTASLAYLALTYFEGWRSYVLIPPMLLSLDMSTAIQFGAWKKRLEALNFVTILLMVTTAVLLMVVTW